MSEAYEELGGSAKPEPKPPAPAERRHKWKLLAFWGVKTTKHHCERCGTTRVRISHSDRFPSTRYTTLAGVPSEGKAPPCTAL